MTGNRARSTHAGIEERADFAHAHRVVLKIGSSSLTRADGGLDLNRLDHLARVISERRLRGQQVLLVSSGALAAGMGPLGLRRRPRDLATIQAAAAVGQSMLVNRWSDAFQMHHQVMSQVLLTADDVMRRKHYANAQRSLERLLAMGVVPVINENDAVATHELRFGDNDRLAALVSHLVRADGLILLTDVNGLYDRPPARPGAQRIADVYGLEDLDGLDVTGRGSSVGTGGMVTKVEAAAMSTESGIPVLLAAADDLEKALNGKDVGTFFHATARHRPARSLWLAFAANPAGRVVLDAGAVHAVTRGKRSLLAAGVVDVEGDFESGDVVELAGDDGRVVARGMVGYPALEIRAMQGMSSEELNAEGFCNPRPVVHRDQLAEVPALRPED